MTKQEFIDMLQEFVKKEIENETNKYLEENDKQNGDHGKAMAHLGASNEAEKIFNVIVRSFIQ
ncbi:MAG: hypothetical protein WC333_06610 [Dehalococcoidia bacterium]|jgi:hypothetical protein